MRPSIRVHTGLLAVALLVAALVIGTGGTARGMSAGTAATAGTMTYTDPAGDAGGGPDVVMVTIDGDPATSMLSVTVFAPGYMPTTPDAYERNAQVWIDADRNGATGDPIDGTEYGLVRFNDSTGAYWNFVRWTGSDWVSAHESPTISASRSGDALTWRVSTSDIGGSTTFDFYVHACIWDTAAERHLATDDAPDGDGWWTYSLTGTTPSPPPVPPAPTTKVSLLIASPKVTPARAIAGKRFTVNFPVQFQIEEQFTSIDLETGETKTGWMISWTAVPTGKMVCDPSVAGKVITHSESFKGSRARLSFLIPKTAKGKLLKVRVKITATEKETGQTVSASKIATFRVR
jgi:hypothetical protein